MRLSDREREGSVHVDPLKKRMVGKLAQYVVQPWGGENTSGLKIFGTHVLVKMDLPSDKIGSIIIVDAAVDQAAEAATTGHICAMGQDAFQVTRNGLRWDGERPAVGARVYIEKYAGVKAVGSDGASYRIMEDTCIACVISDDILRVEE